MRFELGEYHVQLITNIPKYSKHSHESVEQNMANTAADICEYE